MNKQVRRANAPDLILYNGAITMLDAKSSIIKAIAIRNGKIIAFDDQSGRIKALADQAPRSSTSTAAASFPGSSTGTSTDPRGLPLLHAGRPARPRHQPVDGARHVRGQAAELPAGKWIWTTQAVEPRTARHPDPLHVRRAQRPAPTNPLFIQGVGFSRGAREPGRAHRARPRARLARRRARRERRPDRPAHGASQDAHQPGRSSPSSTSSAIDGEADCLADFIRRGQPSRPHRLEGRDRQRRPLGHRPQRAATSLHVYEAVMQLYRQTASTPASSSAACTGSTIGARLKAETAELPRLPRGRHVQVPRPRRGRRW